MIPGLIIPHFTGQARCAEADPDRWFPEKGGRVNAAKRVCAACEIRPECLAYALAAGEPYGVWGGLTGRERQRLLRRGARRDAA